MIKVAIVTNKMIVGGVEKALIEMLKSIDFNVFSVDLYVVHSGGELINKIPNTVKVIPIKLALKERSYVDVFKGLRQLLYFSATRLTSNFNKECYFASKLLLPAGDVYDIAISYHAPNTIPVYYTIDGIRARKKVLWLHGDLANNADHYKVLLKYYKKYNYACAVSDYIRDEFATLFSNVKTITFHNYLDIEKIQMLSAQKPDFGDGFSGYRILTVARLVEEKGIDLAIQACRLILDAGYNIRWYICGDGYLKEKLKKLTEELQVDNQFIFIGHQDNPYSFMANCSLYVQPSRFEGYCTTTVEAKILKKAVVTTNVSGASEQFNDGVNGWIAKINAKDIADKIMYCLDNLPTINSSLLNYYNDYENENINAFLKGVIKEQEFENR